MLKLKIKINYMNLTKFLIKEKFFL
jgi:hypothetical protein